MKANILLINISFNYNDARAFNRATGCIFKCETKMKLAKTIKKNGFLSNNFFA